MEPCSDMKEFTSKETAMLLYLKEAIKRSGGDDLLFFQTAYLWMFDYIHECVADVAQYRLHGIIPPYVCQYVKHLQNAGT